MTSILQLIGFPPPDRRDSVRFYFAKSIPYNLRIAAALLLLVAGLSLQIIFLNVFSGVIFLIIGIGLVLVKGYDSRVRLKSFDLDPQWKEVGIEKIQELEDLRMKTRKWDRDVFDISNALGVLSFIGILILGALFVFVSMKYLGDQRILIILLVDTFILLAPLWFTGMKFILKQPNLAIRVNLILKLHEAFKKVAREGEKFKPFLMLKEGEGKKVPIDAKFAVAFSNAKPEFYGMQAQININIVQGNSYPYFYCVLAGKPGLGLGRFSDMLPLQKDIICEFQHDEKAEVLVIRQRTTKKSGYHTDERRCIVILQVALESARFICSRI